MTNGKHLVDLARNHISERYVLGCHVPKDLSSWKGPWDCAEFASWLVYQLAGYLYGCTSNTAAPSTADAFSGAWLRDAKKIGREVSIIEAINTPGAFLVRDPSTPKFGGHVALSAGDGTTIEAYSAKAGVIAGKATGRRWDCGVLVPGFDYKIQKTLDVSYVTPVITLRLVHPPMRGVLVGRVQEALASPKHMLLIGKPDQVYGPHTASAVAAFQAMSGLLADGEAGPATLKALGVNYTD